MTKDARLETTRRKAIAGLGAGVGIVAGITTPARAQTARKAFVLVHGSWHGGWCWRRVADLLEKSGHKVYAPHPDRVGGALAPDERTDHP